MELGVGQRGQRGFKGLSAQLRGPRHWGARCVGCCGPASAEQRPPAKTAKKRRAPSPRALVNIYCPRTAPTLLSGNLVSGAMTAGLQKASCSAVGPVRPDLCRHNVQGRL